MITRLRLINYRSHRDTTVTLEPLTVFIGPVASGKSNAFNALGQPAAFTRRSPVGTILMSFHFRESPTTVLTNPALDPKAGIPECKACAVRVEEVGEPAPIG